MDFEVDFLPVGDGKKSGDAIALRYSRDSGAGWMVGVVDGGTQESGEFLCEHIQQYYGTSKVDFVICTHPEQDHASGLSVVLDNMQVTQVLMHKPWEHVDAIDPLVTDGRVTEESLRRRLIEGHPYAYAIKEKCDAKRIPIIEPFVGASHGIPNLTVLGPSSDYYLACLANFRSVTEVTEDDGIDVFDVLRRAARSVIRWISEGWNEESLGEPADDAVSSENNSSVISLFTFGDKKVLLTADAGVPALNRAIGTVEALDITLNELAFLQVPHHGSRRNVGPLVLDRLLGPRRPEGSAPESYAYISASKEGEPKHPSKRVVNALIRRGAKVFVTQGGTKRHFTQGMPDRGWQTATPLPFYDEVEEDF